VPVGEEPPPEEPDDEEDERSEKRVITRDNEQRSLQARWKLQDVFKELLEQAAGRLVASEVKAIRRAISTLPTDGEAAFRLWLGEFFKSHRSFAEQVLGPVLRAYMDAVSGEAISEMDADPAELKEDVDAFIEEYTTAFGARHVSSGEAQLIDLLDKAETPDEATELVSTRLGEWEEKSAKKIALNESTQAGAAVSRMVYAGAGVSVLVWRANRKACPICVDMDGRTVEISGPFLSPGDTVEGDETVQTLEVKQIRNHPPLHGGCLCSVSPG